MPTSRRTKSATNSRVCINTGAQHLSPSVPPRPFPIFQYASIVGVHAILFGFTALYLPQSTRLLMTFDARVTDRPQSIFMETLTVCPPVTAAWVCLGLCVLQPWWAGWMDKWYCNDRRAKDTTNEVNVERAKYHWLWLLVRVLIEKVDEEPLRSYVETTRCYDVYPTLGTRCTSRDYPVWSTFVQVNTSHDL